MKKIMKKFALRLRELRGGLSQKEMAEKLGIPQQTYAGWELGNRQPKLEMLEEISLQFAVSADWLLGLTDTRSGGSPATATNGSAAATGHARATVTNHPPPPDPTRLLSIIESQQRVIETLSQKH